MIKITLKQLQAMGACEGGIEWFRLQPRRVLKRIIPALLKDGKARYAFWLLPRLMTHPQEVNFAIYAAEQVLERFEERYPTDKRPRAAIQAAKDFLAGKITANAANAAANAANAAANAANAAANAAYAAANAAAHAANAAYAAAYAACAAYAAAYAAVDADEMRARIAQYGLELLGEGGKRNGK